MQKKREENGITLVALVVTIIILLILAGITVASLTGDNGLIHNAGNAKEQAEIANEKEILEQAATVAMGRSKRGNITKDNLDKELDKTPGSGNYSSENTDEGIKVTFKSNRNYLIDKDGNVSSMKVPEPEPEKSTENVKTMLYGVIEIEFLNEYSYNTTGVPNKPVLTPFATTASDKVTVFLVPSSYNLTLPGTKVTPVGSLSRKVTLVKSFEPVFLKVIL